MKGFFKIQILLLAVALFSTNTKVEAQGFGLSVSPSASSVLVNNSLTYTINLTNSFGVPVNTRVTNALPDSVQILSVTASQGTYTTSGSTTLFLLGGFSGNAQLTVSARPTTAGFITNTVTVGSFDITNTISTNVVVEVTNAPATQIDLGVTINGPVQAVITNDLTSYEVMVTNAGPGTAPGVFLTNTLPPGVNLLGPTSGYTLSGSNMIFSLGTLASGDHTNLQISIQPTNVDVLNLIASAGASSNVFDVNLTNNIASNNVPVIAYLPGTLLAITNSAQTINVQNGLTEQTILLSNTGTNAVAAVRIVVTGLTNQLFNAVGTNGASPFVVYSTGLATNGSVSLLLQYFPRSMFPFTNGQLHAYAVPVPDWTPPAAASTSSNINISRIVQLASGSVMIEFPAVTNRAYTVVYSDNVLFSNAMIAPPSVVAPANRVQWIDYGPPTTVSAPTNTGTRFYRVFQNP